MIQYAVEYWDGKGWSLGHSERDLKLTPDGDIPMSICDQDYGFCKVLVR